MKRWAVIVYGTFQEFRKDNASTEAAAIAYYSLFSLFPLVLVLVAISSFFRPSAEAWQDVTNFIQGYLPISVDMVRENINQAIKLRGPMGMVGILGLLWSASGVFSVIHRAVNKAWDISHPRPFWLEKLLALGMVAVFSLLLTLSTMSASTLSIIRHFRLPLLDWQPLGGDLLWRLTARILSNGFSALLFLLTYKFLPYRRVRWADVWLGAILAGVAWGEAKGAFAWYVSEFSRFNLVYGSLGVIIALLTWAYITGMILLMGAEFTAEYARIAEGLGSVEEEWEDLYQDIRGYLMRLPLLRWILVQGKRGRD